MEPIILSESYGRIRTKFSRRPFASFRPTLTDISHLLPSLIEGRATVLQHSKADDVVPFADSVELVSNSGLPDSALVEVGSDHRLAEVEPLRAMLKACERP